MISLSPVVWKGSAGRGVEEIMFIIELDYFLNSHITLLVRSYFIYYIKLEFISVICFV